MSHDQEMCCGTTCDKAAIAKYIEQLEMALAVMSVVSTGNNPHEIINGIEKFDEDEITDLIMSINEKLFKEEYL